MVLKSLHFLGKKALKTKHCKFLRQEGERVLVVKEWKEGFAGIWQRLFFDDLREFKANAWRNGVAMDNWIRAC
jgi:hypothetical protein